MDSLWQYQRTLLLHDLLDWMEDSQEQLPTLENSAKKLQARKQYERSFGHMTVKLQPCADYKDRVFVTNNPIPMIIVSGLPFCFEYLEYFGSDIKKLIVHFLKSGNLQLNERIRNEIFEYGVSLVQIEFVLLTTASTEINILNNHPIQPNQTVETIIFDTVNFGPQLNWLARYYQGVTVMHIQNVTISHDFASGIFGNLTVLSILLDNWNLRCMRTKQAHVI